MTIIHSHHDDHIISLVSWHCQKGKVELKERKMSLRVLRMLTLTVTKVTAIFFLFATTDTSTPRTRTRSNGAQAFVVKRSNHCHNHNYNHNNAQCRIGVQVHSPFAWHLRATAETLAAEDVYLQRQGQRAGDTPQMQPEIVYIIMYNAGMPNEGVHTTKFPREEGPEVLLAFAALPDAMDMAAVLKQDATVIAEAGGEPVPTPAPYDQMSKAAWEMGIVLHVVPE